MPEALTKLETDKAMTSSADQIAALKVLEAALETYGGDRTRWPAEVRRNLSGFIADNKNAQRLVAEAQALDQVLDNAPAVSVQRRMALAGRIQSEVMNEVRRHTGSVRRPVAVRSRDTAYAGLALAASLVLGVLAGTNAKLEPAMQIMASGTVLEADAASSQIAVNDDGFGAANEDLL